MCIEVASRYRCTSAETREIDGNHPSSGGEALGHQRPVDVRSPEAMDENDGAAGAAVVHHVERAQES